MATSDRRFQAQILVIGTAVFAGLWAVVRARVQSVTIDEADTYLFWVARTTPAHWEAASNNHVLNSLLMRLCTSLFGASQFTIRLPALAGAGIYIAAAYGFCRLLTREARLQWLALVCLVFNPFVFDYLVAARGYSLAMAFLMAALVLSARAKRDELCGTPRWPMERVAAVCSACTALSFAANFSFAFVDVAAMLATFWWFCRGLPGARARLRMLAACTLPGLAVAVFLTASVVMQFPRGELHYGAWSLGEMFGSVARDSLYELNPQIVNPLLLGLLARPRHFLLPLLAACALWRMLAALRRRPANAGMHEVWLRSVGAVWSATLAIALLAHWLAFRQFRILLPMDRTALFVAVIGTMLIGVAAALPAASPDWSRGGLIAMLFAVGFYYLGCMRLSYFQEWRWDADVDKVYPVLAYYSRTYGITSVVSEWRYTSSLSFYRALAGPAAAPAIRSSIPIPEDGPMYVLDIGFEEDFVKRLGLRVVYHGDTTDVVVAVRPELLHRNPGAIR